MIQWVVQLLKALERVLKRKPLPHDLQGPHLHAVFQQSTAECSPATSYIKACLPS
ncbi:MAG: hypothetical protein ACRD11_07855 [Terriglobia bacterium]